MSITFAESMDLHRIRTHTEETSKKLDSLNRKMDRQIALLEKMVEILKERRTDADY